jgi:hypothetical protein
MSDTLIRTCRSRHLHPRSMNTKNAGKNIFQVNWKSHIVPFQERDYQIFPLWTSLECKSKATPEIFVYLKQAGPAFQMARPWRPLEIAPDRIERRPHLRKLAIQSNLWRVSP